MEAGASYFRDGKTTIKIKFLFFGGGDIGGREENCQKPMFVLGIAMTIKFECANFIVENFVVFAQAPFYYQRGICS